MIKTHPTKTHKGSILILIITLTLLSPIAYCQEIPCNITVCFSPRGGCTDTIVKEISNAKTTIHILAYELTSNEISHAIISSRTRGVDVKIILDNTKTREPGSKADLLTEKKIQVLTDRKHKRLHSKVIMLDQKTVITGSFNFTKTAEQSNAENLLIIRNKDLAAKYLEDWTKHEAHSKPYKTTNTQNGESK